MTAIQTFQNSSFKVQCVCVDGNPWFRGKDVATVLGYVNTKQALIKNVDEDDKQILSDLLALANEGGLSERPPKSRGDSEYPLDSNAKNSVFINESGLYSLILRSDKPEAKTFKKWVCSEVLPSIRKTGSYVAPPPPPAITSMFNKSESKTDHSFHSENDLHFKVVDYIRRFHPHAKMTAGLGEFQTTIALRIEGKMKGYQKGTADLMIMNNHLEFRGFCMEFKNPKGTGSLAEAQDAWLHDLHLNGYKVLVSNDYDVICREIDTYFKKVMLACPHCVSKPIYFKTETTMQQHIVAFHRISK